MFGLRIAWGGKPARVLALAGIRKPARKKRALAIPSVQTTNPFPGARVISDHYFLGNRKLAPRRRLSGTVVEPKGIQVTRVMI